MCDNMNIKFDGPMYKRINRWKYLLEEYNYRIKYIKGINNLLADYLSRNPINSYDDDDKEKKNFLQHIKINKEKIEDDNLLFTLPNFEKIDPRDLETEIVKLHSEMIHPGIDKMYNTLKSVMPQIAYRRVEAQLAKFINSANSQKFKNEY
ncbi:Transposon Tf2-6 polyprotein [Dictyocoela muelleri]|nr:Transposon Tf2-6 polyprotein [Dictyocoela muelleri]